MNNDLSNKRNRPQGEWAFDEKGYFYCDQCGKYPHDQYATTDFCPNCGADMRDDSKECTDPIIKAIQENNAKYDERPSIDFSRMSCDLGDSTEAERKSDNLPSCNSCLHNGTWDCIKCKGFDKYERR